MVWCGIIIQHQHLSYKLISHFNYSIKAGGCLRAVFSFKVCLVCDNVLLVIFVNFQKCKNVQLYEA